MQGAPEDAASADDMHAHFETGFARGSERGFAVGHASGLRHGRVAGKKFGFELGYASGVARAALLTMGPELAQSAQALERSCLQVKLEPGMTEDALTQVRGRIRVLEAKTRLSLSVVRAGVEDSF